MKIIMSEKELALSAVINSVALEQAAIARLIDADSQQIK